MKQSVDDKLAEMGQTLHRVERNVETLIKMMKLVLTDMGIRKELHELAEELEGNGSIPPPAVRGEHGR